LKRPVTSENLTYDSHNLETVQDRR